MIANRVQDNGPDIRRYANRWFVRQTPYACTAFAFVHVEVHEFHAGETLTLRCRLTIANGNSTAARVEAAE